MGNPKAARAVTPAAGERAFDVDAFLDGSGTLYLLGANKEHGSVAPLVAALTTEVYERAVARASGLPHGRLDPPLLLALDEVASVCPVELDRWTAVAGGWGIPIVYAVQSPSQLYDRWGRLPGQTIWNNTTARVILGGLANGEYLEEISKLCGERDDVAVTVSRSRWQRTGSSAGPRRLPVMSPAAIRGLQPFQALVIYRNQPPVLARLTPIWKR
jgi:type IV secretory pathway TraG/TraD family ATPase VirD4